MGILEIKTKHLKKKKQELLEFIIRYFGFPVPRPLII